MLFRPCSRDRRRSLALTTPSRRAARAKGIPTRYATPSTRRNGPRPPVASPVSSRLYVPANLEIQVPKQVEIGSSIQLGCEWQVVGGNGLYSVKWYKDDHEFFRYVPDDSPSILTFKQPGINIDVSISVSELLQMTSNPDDLLICTKIKIF